MITLSGIFAFLFGACSSSNKIAALKPTASNNVPPLVRKNVVSEINLPMQIKLSDIQIKTNQLLKDLIYEDNNIEDDNMEVKVWKTAPIELSNVNQLMALKLPLKVYLKYRIGTNKLGLNLYTTKEFNLNGIVELNSDLKMINWKINTKTTLGNIIWKESPTIKLMGKDVAITYLLDPAIKMFKGKIEKMIDENIEKSMEIKPLILNNLKMITEPSLMNEKFNVWLQVIPKEIRNPDLKLQNDAYQINASMKCEISTFVGKKPSKAVNLNEIVFSNQKPTSDKFVTNVMVVTNYADISDLINKNFEGKEFASGNKKVIIKKVSIWNKEKNLVVQLDMDGTIKGSVYLMGEPKYDAVKQEIYFDKMDYALESKSTLLKTANWLAQGYILKKIEENCRYSAKGNIDEGKKMMLGYMQNHEISPGIFVNGNILNLSIGEIEVLNEGMVSNMIIEGNIKINTNGLK